MKLDKEHRVAPVIQIVCLLVFSIAVVYGSVIDLYLAFFLLAGIYFYSSSLSLRTTWRNLKQLRWLLLTIILLYTWATPGQVLFPAWGVFAISREGILLGLGRCLSLIFIFVAVYWMLNSLSRAELSAALLNLLAVFPMASSAKERIAVRVLLSLEMVPQVKHRISVVMDEISLEDKRHWYKMSWLAKVFDRLLLDMENQPLAVIEMPRQVSIPIVQWSYPLLLGLSFWLVD